MTLSIRITIHLSVWHNVTTDTQFQNKGVCRIWYRKRSWSQLCIGAFQNSCTAKNTSFRGGVRFSVLQSTSCFDANRLRHRTEMKCICIHFYSSFMSDSDSCISRSFRFLERSRSKHQNELMKHIIISYLIIKSSANFPDWKMRIINPKTNYNFFGTLKTLKS